MFGRFRRSGDVLAAEIAVHFDPGAARAVTRLAGNATDRVDLPTLERRGEVTGQAIALGFDPLDAEFVGEFARLLAARHRFESAEMVRPAPRFHGVLVTFAAGARTFHVRRIEM